MKFLESWDLEDLNKAMDRIIRRVMTLEDDTTVVFPRSAPTNPVVSQAWHDIEQGKLKIFNGTTWDEWSKD